MAAPTVKEPTDSDPGTAAKWGAPDAVHLVTIIKGTHATERVPIAATEGTAVNLSDNQVITGVKTINHTKLEFNNPATTFQYIVNTSAITADRNITLPLLVADDTFVFENFIQTLTNKTINASSNTISNLTNTSISATANIAITKVRASDTEALKDENGNEFLIFSTTASALNEFTIKNGSTGVMPSLKATGETNIGLLFTGKGTGKVTIGDAVDDTKRVNVEVVGATTAKTTTLTFVHTDNRTITYPDATTTLVGHDTTQTLSNKTLTAPKFADLGFIADANGNELIILDTVASAVNELTLANAAASNDVTLSMTGGDTDVSLKLVPKGAGMVYGVLETIPVAISDETTDITTGAAKVTFRMPYAFKVLKVKASLSTAGSSGSQFDINEGGTSILSTKLTIDANELTSATAATPAVISDSALADDAEITIDIDTAGTGAKGAKVYIIGYATAKFA